VSHLHATLDQKTYPASAGRKFGLTVGIAFLVLSGIAGWRGHPTTLVVLGSLGAVLILAGLTVPTALRRVDRTWMKLALLISRVTTPIFMGVIYYVVLSPVGMLRRAFGANALVHHAGRNGQAGVWFDRSASARSNLDRLF